MRSALVTGGAGGLGAATVRRFHRAGFGVVVFDRAADRAATLADELGERAVAVPGDAGEDADVAAAIAAATALGPLGVLVNVAGGGVGGGPTVGADGTPHDKRSFSKTLSINVTGTFNVSRLAAAAMAANEPDADGQRGVIVHTSSVAAFDGQFGQVAYAAAKAAIAGMTLPMARDLAPLGIRVCTVAPGSMGTPVMLRVMGSLDADPTEGIVFPPRLGRPEEFAQLVEDIVANTYLNGEVIRLDAAVRLAPGR